jgi:hypothetical protein
MAVWYRQLRWRIRQFLRVLLSSRHTSHQIAAGAALGVFIGFTPLLGLQTILAGVLATICRWSRIAAMALVWHTNYATALPVYLFCYIVGARVLGVFGIRSVDADKIRELFRWKTIPETTWIEATRLKLVEAARLGWDAMAPLWLGCTLVGVVAAFIGYWIALRFVKAQRVLRARRMARRARERLSRIRGAQQRGSGARNLDRRGDDAKADGDATGESA